MLNKDILPGDQIKVSKLNANTAGVLAVGVTLTGLTIWEVPGMTSASHAIIGDILTVIKKPRKVHGINLCRVETSDSVQGEVYWTELRGNCTKI